MGITYWRKDKCIERDHPLGIELTGFKMSDGAPAEIEAGADATAYTATTETNGSDYGGHDLLGLYVTKAGGVILHQSKKLHIIVNSSFGTEAFASSRAGEMISYVDELDRAVGHVKMRPRLVTTDSTANATVSSLHGTATRGKHLLRHLHSFMQRVRFGEVTLKHVPDKENPADFLTKWVPAAKFNASIRYLTGQRIGNVN